MQKTTNENHIDQQAYRPSEAKGQSRLVYDLPVRVSHWLMAFLFLAAFGIAQLVDDESPVFSYHMLLGFMLAFVVILRIIWGLVGSRTARFSSMPLSPKQLFDYFKSFIGGPIQKHMAHNPASAWAALLMFFFSIGLAFTGYQMSQNIGHQSKEVFEELHELFANAFLITVIAHIAGIVLHTLRHLPRTGEIIALAMINGRKHHEGSSRKVQESEKSTEQDRTEEVHLKSSYPLVALVLVLLFSGFTCTLIKNYDSNSQTLNLFGKTLQLGENESSEHNESHMDSERNETNEDEDED